MGFVKSKNPIFEIFVATEQFFSIKIVKNNKSRPEGRQKEQVMSNVSTSRRLKQVMEENGMVQSDILNACKSMCEKFGVPLDNNLLDDFVCGVDFPSQDQLAILSRALNVNEVWLMGFDVPPSRELKQYSLGTPDEQQKACEEQNERINRLVELFVQLTDEQQEDIIKMVGALCPDE